MKKIVITCFSFCFITLTFAQKTTKAIKVTYQRSSNGKIIPNQDPLLLYASQDLSLITTDKIMQQKANFPFEQTFVAFNSKTISQLAQLKANKSILNHDAEALGKQKFELTEETKKILNLTCKKAITIVNSNKIEIWYTNELGLKGGPGVLGQDLGLVLETIRNGNSALTATKIDVLKTIPAILALPKVPEVDH